MARGIHKGIVSPETALAHQFTPEEQAFLGRSDRSAIQGTPDQVAERLDGIADSFATNELGVVTICHDFQARVRSYELLAERIGIN